MQNVWQMLENPTVLVMVSGITSLLNYVILQNSRFSWPAQLHDEGAIPTIIVSGIALSILNMFCSNHTSSATNNTMLVEDHATRQKTRAITQLKFQIVKYIGGLVWIVQKQCRFNNIGIA